MSSTVYDKVYRKTYDKTYDKILPGAGAALVDEFTTTWTTTGADETISLPLLDGGIYDFTVDWGDSSSDTITAYDQAEVTHTYSVANTYTVTISGRFIGS